MKRFVCVLALVAAACGGDSGTGPSSQQQARVPSYAGTWRGNYLISGCNQTGGVAAVNICGALGTSPPYTFSLTQSDRNVSGSFMLGTINFPSTGGTIGQDGSLALNATTVSNGVTIVVTWALTLPATAVQGTVTQRWTSDILSGNVTVVGTISTAVKSAASTAPVSLAPGLGNLGIAAATEPLMVQ